MSIRPFIKLTLTSLGIALLAAGLFFNTGTAISSAPQANVTPVATRDRLAEPTLPANPTQADHGAQVYWLSCLPCHGDVGQGLTDEFRQTYPPEDRNCWEAGCHGERPYDNGFKLPKAIPAIVGPTTLQKFSNAAVLQGFIKAAMPFWKPGSLTDEDAWAVTAFLLRQNGLWDARTELNASNADQVPVRATEAESSPVPPTVNNPPDDLSTGWMILAAVVLLVFITWMFIRFTRPQS